MHHLKNLKSGSLGAQFFELQARYRFPGLINECRTLIRIYRLPNIIDLNLKFSKQSWNQLVKKAVRKKSEEDIKIEFSNYSKLKHIDVETEGLKVKEYVQNMSLRNARMFFRIRSHMIDTKFNQKSDQKFAKELWKCNYCKNIETQSHITWCPVFESLRDGKNLKNDSDLVEYFQAVMKIRNEIS